MKLQIVIAALAVLLMPVHGATVRVQCAGGQPDNRGEGSGIIYESSGFLTADFTQRACAASGGSIDPNKKGNEKCCNLPDARQRDFNNACQGQKAGSNYPNFSPTPRGC